eukprot:PITA_29816
MCFLLETGRLLGFFVSKSGIRVDPSKLQAIVKLPPPSTLCQLQNLQQKANFLRRFIPNYAEITKGFTRLLIQNTPFFWDEIAQKPFDALKHALTHAPLLHPPNYNQDYFLYLAAFYSTIGMVLVQEDEFNVEHVIYYLSRTLNPTELKYSHVEKLALATVQAVQRFRHYILLRKTTLLSNCNPMTYILTKQLLGGKYSKWIVILQEFDLEFEKSKSKKSLVFTELMCDFPRIDTETMAEESLADESLFLISTLDPWYGDKIVYLQTQSFQPEISRSQGKKIRFQSQQYKIIGDTLYLHGVDSIFCCCLTHEEAEKVLNDCHSGACGGHMSRLEAMLPIECEILSLQIAIELLPATSEEEKSLLYLAQLDDNRRDVALAIETHAKRIKAQYDRNVTPRNFWEGGLVLLYDQANDKLGAGKFVPMWHGPLLLSESWPKGPMD